MRWPHNLTPSLLNVGMVWLVSPLTPVGTAALAQRHGWGLLNGWNSPVWLSLAAGSILLDFSIYLQHGLFHAVPNLWCLHSMRHADFDFDLTTGLRFHPLEIVLSLAIKVTFIAVLGPPVAAVLVFVILLNGVSMFNHGDVCMPSGIDGLLRWLVVTPDIHCIHHSVIPSETNSNFGFNLPWWEPTLVGSVARDLSLATLRRAPGDDDRALAVSRRRASDDRMVAVTPLRRETFPSTAGKVINDIRRGQSIGETRKKG